MLTEKELKKIALNECVDMLGKDLVEQHKNLCCACWGMEDNAFTYNLGMDSEKREPKRLSTGGPLMEYYAFVKVDPNTGSVTRDYKSSSLPR